MANRQLMLENINSSTTVLRLERWDNLYSLTRKLIQYTWNEFSFGGMKNPKFNWTFDPGVYEHVKVVIILERVNVRNQDSFISKLKRWNVESVTNHARKRCLLISLIGVELITDYYYKHKQTDVRRNISI